MIFFLFPGQGSQKPGMGRDFYDASPPARATFDEAAAIFGDDFLTSVFEGSIVELRDTRLAQVALVTMEVAVARHLIANAVSPNGVAGHSVGEIAALVVAESLRFDDALRFTRERARLMAEESPEGSMAAVIGFDADAIAKEVSGSAEVANFNGPAQTIISGTMEGIMQSTEYLLNAGAKRVLPLNVSGPFHSSLMKPAALILQQFLEDVTIAAPTLDFVSSVTGRREDNPDTIRELLWKQLYSPVRWTDVMETLGTVQGIETGPGTVLQGLAKRTDGAPEVSAAGTLEQANAIEVL